MAASTNDFFQKVGLPGNATNLSAPGHTIAGTTFNVDSTALWSTDTGVTFAIDTVTLVNGEEVRDIGSYTVWTGTVTSSTTIENGVLRYGTDQNYPAGATTRVYILPTSTRENRAVDGILAEHKQTGAHSDVTADSLAVAGASTLTGALTIRSWDGWIAPSNTWTYVSASSFKITGVNVATLFPAGTKIKLTQTTVKYFYVTSATFSSDTTVNITGGTDYTLANAVITSPTFSYVETPQGFPQTFSWTPTFTGFTIGNGTINVAKFVQTGKAVSCRFNVTLGSTSSVTGPIVFSLPVTSVSYTTSTIDTLGDGFIRDAGTFLFKGALLWVSTTTVRIDRVTNNGGNIGIESVSSTNPMTWTTNDQFGGTFTYEPA